MEITQLKELLKKFQSNVFFNYNLKKKTGLQKKVLASILIPKWDLALGSRYQNLVLVAH